MATAANEHIILSVMDIALLYIEDRSVCNRPVFEKIFFSKKSF